MTSQGGCKPGGAGPGAAEPADTLAGAARASTIQCAGCGYLADPDEPYPFRCPRAGTDDTDHVMTRLLGLAVAQ